MAEILKCQLELKIRISLSLESYRQWGVQKINMFSRCQSPFKSKVIPIQKNCLHRILSRMICKLRTISWPLIPKNHLTWMMIISHMEILNRMVQKKGVRMKMKMRLVLGSKIYKVLKTYLTMKYNNKTQKRNWQISKKKGRLSVLGNKLSSRSKIRRSSNHLAMEVKALSKQEWLMLHKICVSKGVARTSTLLAAIR